MTDFEALLAGIVTDPTEETRWLVLADYLEEYDDPRRGELLRLHRRLLATCCESDKHEQREAWHEAAPEERNDLLGWLFHYIATAMG